MPNNNSRPLGFVVLGFIAMCFGLIGLLWFAIDQISNTGTIPTPRPTITPSQASVVEATEHPRLELADKMVIQITGKIDSVYAAKVDISVTFSEPVTTVPPFEYIVTSNVASCSTGLNVLTFRSCPLNNFVLDEQNPIPLSNIRVSIPGCFQNQELIAETNGRSFQPITRVCDP